MQRLECGAEGGDGHQLPFETPNRVAAHSLGRHQHGEIHVMLHVLIAACVAI